MNDLARHGILLAGGGIDSAVCMHIAKESGVQCRALHVDYGQVAAEQEWIAVKDMANEYCHPVIQIKLGGMLTHAGGELNGRNSFLVHLALLQKTIDEGRIYIGIHRGTNFYDCSRRFFKLCSTLVSEQTDGRVQLLAPLLEYSKREIVEYARGINIPIARTYSCQRGGDAACGKCLSCLDREACGC